MAGYSQLHLSNVKKVIKLLTRRIKNILRSFVNSLLGNNVSKALVIKSENYKSLGLEDSFSSFDQVFVFASMNVK